MRVSIIFDNFGPYHVARLTAAAKLMTVQGVEVRDRSAVYDWTKSNWPSHIRRACLFGADQQAGISWNNVQNALDRELTNFSPDAVAIPGWSSMAAISALYWAVRHNVGAIVMSESNASDFKRYAASEWIKSQILNSADAALVSGVKSKAYLVRLNLEEGRIFTGYDAVDNDYFATYADVARRTGEMPEIEGGQRLDKRHRNAFFLSSARFVAKKNLSTLLDAYAYYRSHTDTSYPWPLIILGDGDLRGMLEHKRRLLGLEGAVHFPGFKQYGELPRYYGTAGAFVHASRTEQWGLVVNEAMASGLPVAVSDRCGCTQELVEDGVNGVTFPPDDVKAIASALNTIAHRVDRGAMSHASRERIARFGPEQFAEGLRAATQVAMVRNRKPNRIVTNALLWTAALIQAQRC